MRGEIYTVPVVLGTFCKPYFLFSLPPNIAAMSTAKKCNIPVWDKKLPLMQEKVPVHLSKTQHFNQNRLQNFLVYRYS